jgi:hypothetical protein
MNRGTVKNKEDNPMKSIKCIIIFPLCFLMGSCPVGPEIDIGDYEYQLEKWNNQNLLDYTLVLSFSDRRSEYTVKRAVITVRNGIPESSDPPEWLTSGEKSTVPNFFSFIKKEEKKIKEYNDSSRLIAKYNTEYHYPRFIQRRPIGGIQNPEPFPVWTWIIALSPLAENEQGNGER